MTEPTPARLAVAVDGAGWHPSAWREKSVRPAQHFTPQYWASLAAETEHGLLDFVTIEDTLALFGQELAPDQSIIRGFANDFEAATADGADLIEIREAHERSLADFRAAHPQLSGAF